ncbi:transposase [Flavobacterium salmonis]|uniref:Transposase IS200-like domain-containing protein n=2 Tax=Flavobacterium salmonis TaxID=2654844 RepID=A0A6V6Z978_9FLAO|nr:transposase [Flavobacterium salmonis]CAD0008205.1 hypothetical protein FLAT13_04246 [Flavobacterium salmonis]
MYNLFIFADYHFEMAKFRNKYRIGSHRLRHWDYSSKALYFLTIVTQNRECVLGDIIAGEIKLSEMGKIVENEFLKSFEIRNELFLHDYIIMPNHLHMVVEICDSGNESESIKPNRPVRLSKSISSFIAGFKSAVNNKIDDYIDEHHLPIPKYNKQNHFFQPNYHDHIVRNDFEYQRIANYIIQNPIVWENDKLNRKK